MKRKFDEESEVVFYHVIIKVPDNTHGNKAYAFKREHKVKLRDLLFWLESIYELQCVNYCIMSTHAHFVIRHDRESKLSLRECAHRFKKYKALKETPDARSCEVRKFCKRLNNISDFLANLQKRFTAWYNQQFDKRRRGQLFNHNFKAIQLKNRAALIRCLQYVELNPVRAKMVKNIEAYEFSSWADIVNKTTRRESLKKTIVCALRDFGIKDKSEAQIFEFYARELKLINQAIELYGDCHSLDEDLIKLVLKRHPFWSKGRSLSILDNELILQF